MNELIVKNTLKSYLETATDYLWDAKHTPRCWINIYSGEAHRNDRILTPHSPSRIFIQFNIEETNTDLDALDTELLTIKDAIEAILRLAKNIPKISGLAFNSWEKEIQTESVSESTFSYRGNLTLTYSAILSGY